MKDTTLIKILYFLQQYGKKKKKSKPKKVN